MFVRTGGEHRPVIPALIGEVENRVAVCLQKVFARHAAGRAAEHFGGTEQHAGRASPECEERFRFAIGRGVTQRRVAGFLLRLDAVEDSVGVGERRVLRVERDLIRAIPGAADEMAAELPVCVPHGDAAGEAGELFLQLVSFHHPERAVIRHGEGLDLMQCARVVYGGLLPAARADGAKQFSAGRKDLHLIIRAVVVDEQIPSTVECERPRLFHVLQIQRLRSQVGRFETQQAALSGEHEFSLRIDDQPVMHCIGRRRGFSQHRPCGAVE